MGLVRSGVYGWGKQEGNLSRTFEGSLVGDIVDEQNAHSTAVVGSGNSAEPFLTSRIPDLQLNPLAVELDGPDLKVDADRGDK